MRRRPLEFPMSRAGRIIGVTVGLSVAGAFFGALTVAVALALGIVITEGLTDIFCVACLEILALPAIVGAIVGGIAVPAVAWLLLRQVALGQAVAWTTV